MYKDIEEKFKILNGNQQLQELYIVSIFGTYLNCY